MYYIHLQSYKHTLANSNKLRLYYVPDQKLFWSTAWTISIVIWGLAIFWAAVPLIGWGVYDFEPMRTCCTLDYTKGDK